MDLFKLSFFIIHSIKNDNNCCSVVIVIIIGYFISKSSHEYGYYDEQDIKRVVKKELTKVSINKWNWNWKKNLILNSVNALKNLKVEQVNQKFQDNNYTLNKDLDKLITKDINN